MKKKAIVWIVLAVLAVACVIAVVSKQKNGVEGIAAVYGTHDITLEEVDQYRAAAALAGGEALQSDRAVAERLLRSRILLEEAEKRGIAATEAEIQAQLDATKQWYAENEEVRQRTDVYCANAGISFEEYLHRLEAQLPATIARAKFVEAAGAQEVEQLVAEALQNATYYVD